MKSKIIICISLFLSLNLNAQKGVKYCFLSSIRGGDAFSTLLSENLTEKDCKNQIDEALKVILINDKSFYWEYKAISEALIEAKFNKSFSLTNNSSENIATKQYSIVKTIYYMYFRNALKTIPSSEYENIELNENWKTAFIDDLNKAHLLSMMLADDENISNVRYLGTTDLKSKPNTLINSKSDYEILGLIISGTTGAVILWYYIVCNSDNSNSDLCQKINNILNSDKSKTKQIIDITKQ